MARDAARCDVLVVGAGPAAGTAARLLARWGHDVLIVAKPDGGEPELPESLTPSCQKFFDLLGISAEIEAAGFVRSTGHTVWWGTAERRSEPFSDGTLGWQATTGRLSRVMRDAAVAAGARLQRTALTADDVLDWPAAYRLDCSGRTAAYRLDCSGRTGVLAKARGGRRYEAGHRTVALVGTWRHPAEGWPVDDPSHTLLESYADGWAWSVPIDARDRAVAVMVDPRTTALARGDGAAAVYRGEIAKTRHLAALTQGAALVSGPAGWDASMYSADRPAGDAWLLVGDAASFVDPLSSAGVKKAMASGWLAAIAVNTALTRPAMRATAFDFYAAREIDTYQQFLALTRRHLHDGAADLAHPFWTDRTATPSAVSGVDRERVQAAFERLRHAPALSFRPGPGLRFEQRPAIGEREIVMERRIVDDDAPDGVRYVHGVDVVALVELAPGHVEIIDLFENYQRRAGSTALPEFLTAISTAVARGWLGEV